MTGPTLAARFADRLTRELAEVPLGQPDPWPELAREEDA